ncbi:MAG: hypothetical protein ACPGSO_07075 [Vicingaceae bacterium]
MKNLTSYILLLFACVSNLNISAAYIAENDTTDKGSYYFVSNRNNTNGKYTMYKARENTSGISSCLIKGNFEVEDFSDMRQAEIVVYDLATNELVGIYNTNPVTGNYLMVLELNVKYEFEITAYNHPPFIKTVEIPSFASTDISDAISTQKIYLKMQGEDIQFDLTTKIIEENEPTLFLLTVYNDKEKELKQHVDLYQGKNLPEIVPGKTRINETDFGDVQELLKSQVKEKNKQIDLADKAFKRKDFTNAIPLYSKLLEEEKDNPLFNFRKGASIFYADENKLNAIPYLIKGIKSPENTAHAYYLIGQSYHLSGVFTEAISYYKSFNTRAKPESLKHIDAARLIENCENGIKLISKQYDMLLINKTPVNINEIETAYPSVLVANKLKPKTEFFQSPIDKKKSERILMFETGYSETLQPSYGVDENRKDKDIYINLQKGKDFWGIPHNVGNKINTPYDENYVYVTPDGKTMYFSSKGHNSMGGYDIFVSKRNSSKEYWGEAKNLGYPVNSPYDDILYVPSTDGKTAQFSSNRKTTDGSYNLYEIETPKKPELTSSIRGHFMTTDSFPVFKATIAVYNTNNNEFVGLFETNPINGNYTINLMPKIKYKYVLQCPGYKEHTAFVTLPVKTEFFTFRQDIKLKKEASFEILKVDNFFTKQESENAPEYKLTSKDYEKKKQSIINKKLLEANPLHKREPNADQLKVLAGAERFMLEENYEVAATEYGKVASFVNLNKKQSYYYGKALFMTSQDYEKTLFYLEKAGTSKNTPYDLYFMLGKTNHNTYRFEKAIKAFEHYQSLATEKEREDKNLDAEINLSKNGKRLMTNPKPIEVISKKEIAKNKLHTIYNSINLKSKFLLAPEDMTSAKDKKNGFRPVMHLNKAKTTIHYSSYGDNDHKDIYLRRKLPSGWSEPLNLGPIINTEGDENFPYVTPDGKTLYFCSTKHGSMGGYDIYKSEWDEEKAIWGLPENMGAPINSPFDDLFFVK